MFCMLALKWSEIVPAGLEKGLERFQYLLSESKPASNLRLVTYVPRL